MALSVTKDEHVQILDFGLAKRAERASEQTNAPTGSGVEAIEDLGRARAAAHPRGGYDVRSRPSVARTSSL